MTSQRNEIKNGKKTSEEALIDGESIGVIGKLTVAGESTGGYTRFESASRTVFTKLGSQYGPNAPLLV